MKKGEKKKGVHACAGEKEKRDKKRPVRERGINTKRQGGTRGSERFRGKKAQGK